MSVIYSYVVNKFVEEYIVEVAHHGASLAKMQELLSFCNLGAFTVQAVLCEFNLCFQFGKLGEELVRFLGKEYLVDIALRHKLFQGFSLFCVLFYQGLQLLKLQNAFVGCVLLQCLKIAAQYHAMPEDKLVSWIPVTPNYV